MARFCDGWSYIDIDRLSSFLGWHCDSFDHRIHNRSSYYDDEKSQRCLYDAECPVFHEAKRQEPFDDKGDTQQEEPELDHIFYSVLLWSNKWDIQDRAISREPEKLHDDES